MQEWYYAGIGTGKEKKILKSRYKATIVGGQEGCPEAEENTIFPTENEISRLFNP